MPWGDWAINTEILGKTDCNIYFLREIRVSFSIFSIKSLRITSMCETYAAIQTQSYSMGIFCQTHFFFVKLPKPCVWWQKHVVLKTMREMERECCPLRIGMRPLAQVTMLNSARAPGEKKKHAILKYQVTLCVSHSLYHCRTSVCWLIQDCQTHRAGAVDESPLFVSKAMNHTHSSAEQLSSW